MADRTPAMAGLAQGLDRLDVLVNNAGQNLPGGRSEWDPDVFEEVVAANLFGCVPLDDCSGEGSWRPAPSTAEAASSTWAR